MKSYSYVAMCVDGKQTSTIEIWREGNIFRAYEYDEAVYAGGWLGLMEYIKKWKESKTALKKYLEETIGAAVTFEQTISE